MVGRHVGRDRGVVDITCSAAPCNSMSVLGFDRSNLDQPTGRKRRWNKGQHVHVPKTHAAMGKGMSVLPGFGFGASRACAGTLLRPRRSRLGKNLHLSGSCLAAWELVRRRLIPHRPYRPRRSHKRPRPTPERPRPAPRLRVCRSASWEWSL